MQKIIQILLLFICSLFFVVVASAQYEPEALYGLWQIKRIGTLKIPATQAAKITIGEGQLLMHLPEGENDVHAEWTLKGDKKTMKITTESGNEELWKVENLSETALTLFDIKSEKLMILTKINTTEVVFGKDKEPIDDGSGNYAKIAVPEHQLMARWSFVKSEGKNVGLKPGDMIIELLENGAILLSMGGESVEGLWVPADEHTSIEVTVNDNTEKWWLHQYSSKELKIVDKGVVFVFERK